MYEVFASPDIAISVAESEVKFNNYLRHNI